MDGRQIVALRGRARRAGLGARTPLTHMLHPDPGVLLTDDLFGHSRVTDRDGRSVAVTVAPSVTARPWSSASTAPAWAMGPYGALGSSGRFPPWRHTRTGTGSGAGAPALPRVRHELRRRHGVGSRHRRQHRHRHPRRLLHSGGSGDRHQDGRRHPDRPGAEGGAVRETVLTRTRRPGRRTGGLLCPVGRGVPPGGAVHRRGEWRP